MHLDRVFAIVLRQLSDGGSPARVLPLFAWVAIDIVLWVSSRLPELGRARGIDSCRRCLGPCCSGTSSRA
jgi:ABC-2 type transport system permease protein